MFGSEVLDVAIGLSFVYLVLGLITSAASEMIEAALRRRASSLRRGLCQMLGDPQGSGLVRALYNHPLINSLFPDDYSPLRHRNLPSYIPARNFALALMDTMASSRSETGQPSGAAGATVVLNAPPPATVLLASSTLRTAAEANKVVNPAASQAILTLLDAAGDDPARARENIEAWFNSTMDRVSGAYKRRTQMMLLVIGLLISVLMNADSINIVTSLATNEAVRQTLVNSAGASPAAAPASEYGALVRQALDPVKAAIPACQADGNSPDCRLQYNLSQLRRSGLPVGWTSDWIQHDPRGLPRTGGEWFTKVVGLVITGFAVSLGAPFWFDVLNRIMVVRSTIKPREKSPEEPAKS